MSAVSSLDLFSLLLFVAAQCKADTDCVYDKACIEGNCLNPCVHGAVQCGRGAECLVQAHRAQCVCPAGTQGDPFLSCVAAVCQYNEDCADHEACDRLNRVCRPVCDDETCAATATCTGRKHQPVCSCPPGTSGNPYIECLGEQRGMPSAAPRPTRQLSLHLLLILEFVLLAQKNPNPGSKGNKKYIFGGNFDTYTKMIRKRRNGFLE